VVADGGYTTRDNIEKLAGREIDFLGGMRWENVPSGAQPAEPATTERIPLSAGEESLRLPEGKVLHPQGRRQKTARADLLPLRS